ncbi:hypothetical protein [Micromonospora sp. NPDC005189]
MDSVRFTADTSSDGVVERDFLPGHGDRPRTDEDEQAVRRSGKP